MNQDKADTNAFSCIKLNMKYQNTHFINICRAPIVFSNETINVNETRNLPEGRTNSLEPPSVLFARASKEFSVPPSVRNAEDEKKRERERESEKGEKRGARGIGAPTQFLLFWYPT